MKTQAKILAKLAALESPKAVEKVQKIGAEILEKIRQSQDNDELFEQLELLEQIFYRTPEIVNYAAEAILDKRPIPEKPIGKLGDQDIFGKTFDQVLEKSIDLLNTNRYYDLKATLNVLFRYARELDKSLQAKTLDTIQRLASYNVHVLKKVGYGVQKTILEAIKGLSTKKLLQNAAAVIEICKAILQPTFEGTTSNYRQITFHSGVVKVNKNLAMMRRDAMDILQKIYLNARSLEDRKKSLDALRSASETPHSHVYGSDMENLVLENSNALTNFYIKIADDADLEVLQDIEESKNWLHRRFGEAKIPKLKTLAKKLADHQEYQYFRVFVGYDGRLDPDFDFERQRSERNSKVEEILRTLDTKNLGSWKRRIVMLATKSKNSNDPGQYQYLDIFLNKIGQEKPDFAGMLITAVDTQPVLEPFLVPLVAGLWKSDKKSARKLLSGWIREGRFLEKCAYIFENTNEWNETLLVALLKKARSKKDVRTLVKLAGLATRFYPAHNSKPLFLAAVASLTRMKTSNWVFDVWFRGSHLLKDLSSKQAEIVLENLIGLPRLDYHAEEILVPFAEKDPEKLADFFLKRVEYQAKRKRGIDRDYDAIPFEFHKLAEPLRNHPEIIPAVLSWYDRGGKNKWLYGWEASQFLENVYPGFNPQLESAVIEQINTRPKEGLRTALAILHRFQGQDFLWNTCKAIIKTHHADKDYEKTKGALFGRLSQTGVVSGEDGFVRAYERKLSEIKAWDDEGDANIRSFLDGYREYLENQREYFARRAEEELELRKREFGEDPTENKEKDKA